MVRCRNTKPRWGRVAIRGTRWTLDLSTGFIIVER